MDQALVERGICDSREKAKRAVLAGMVKINGQPARKASDWVRAEDDLSLDAPEKYVSRGGVKLEHALKEFGADLSGLRVIDLGASTGGFTDCALQHGATHVTAVDVGHGQLAWKLRQDKRVTVMDRTNARALDPGAFSQPFVPFDLALIDCSFISLTKILPAAVALIKPAGKIIALVKPQFEAGKSEVDKGAGVIRDPAIHERVLRELRDFISGNLGLRWAGTAESPILGPAGNKEFLILLETKG